MIKKTNEKKDEKDPYYKTPYNYNYGKFKRKFRRGKFVVEKSRSKDKQRRDIDMTENVDNFLVYQEVKAHIPENMPYEIKWWYYIKGLVPSKVWVLGGYIYAMTSKNLFYCIDRKTGIPLWVTSFDMEILGAPTALPEEYDTLGHVYCVVGKRLFAIDIQEGTISFWRPLDFLPSSGPVITGKGMFIGSWQKFIYCVSEKDGHWRWSTYTNGYVMAPPTIQIPFEKATTIYLGSENNYLHFISLDRTQKELDWSLKTRGPVVSTPVWYPKYILEDRVKNNVIKTNVPPMLFASCRDYNLYAVDLERSKLKWQYAAEKALSTSPVCDDRLVFVKEDNGGNLLAIDKLTGQLKWKVGDGISIAGIDSEYYYVWNNKSQLIRISKAQPDMTKDIYDMSGFVRVLPCANFAGHLAWEKLLEVEPGKFQMTPVYPEQMYVIYKKGVICSLERKKVTAKEK